MWKNVKRPVWLSKLLFGKIWGELFSALKLKCCVMSIFKYYNKAAKDFIVKQFFKWQTYAFKATKA